MSYNRLDFNNGHSNTAYHAGTPPVAGSQVNSRIQSPQGRPPQQGFQLTDMRPGYHQPGSPLEMPMGPPPPGRFTPSDQLAPQPSYSVENIPGTYGHNERFEQGYFPQQQVYHHAQNGASYTQSPRPPQAHDPYWQDDYASTVVNGHSPSPHPQVYPPMHSETGPYIVDDQQPILQPDNPYGADPHTQPGMGGQYPAEEYSDGDDEEPLKPRGATGLNRSKTVKEVQLYHGNLVLDCPIPLTLLNQIPHARPPERDEFTHMRYTAATCDPADFAKEHFTLRQSLFAKRRHTELFIVVTMYNEEDILFARTMVGVLKNIAYMCSRKDSKTWGAEAWKKIVVCVVSDGRAKINPRTRAVLAAMGVYQEGIAKQQVEGKDVTAHIYEYTTQCGIEIGKNDVVRVTTKCATPVQMLFCLKEKNQKKINSHRWFFQAFGTVLEPNICVLIDAGTRPGKDSIYQLWKAFDVEPMCAGACGEIKAGLGNLGKELLNPIVATQNFEYKMSNILDKPLESAFGFITVLPGAFSAYRYVALQNNSKDEGPLNKYFLGEKMHGENAGIFTANMYLAEDRILCFELVSKRRCNWILQYVKSATGETDVPDTVAELIMQRRRWLNGSFFAAIYAITHFYQLFRSDHTFIRKMMFLLEFVYQTIQMLFAWFAIGNFFLVFRILTTSLGDDSLHFAPGRVLSVVFEWLYLATLLSCFVLSMGNRPQGSNKFYMTMVYFWAVLMLYLMFASIYITVISIQQEVAAGGFTVSDLFKNQLFFTLIVSLASTYLLYFFISFLFFDPWHMFTSFIQYLLLTPTYINILNVYAFCNTHDITWGTKGDDKAAALPVAVLKPGTNKLDVAIPTDDADLNTQYQSELAAFAAPPAKQKKVIPKSEKQEDYYKGFRSAVVLVWIFCNLILSATVLQTAGVERLSQDSSGVTQNQRATIYMAVILWSVAGLSAFRTVGAVWFLIVRLFRGV